jgi:hypothetical protein
MLLGMPLSRSSGAVELAFEEEEEEEEGEAGLLLN